ncbi:RloB domain-containing protein [Candidatus Magnetomoraceae bacterium gMMP-1]
MSRKKPKKRLSKKVFLFIVEGCTEENYIKCLKRLYKKSGKTFNCKGGSAKAVMNKAKKLRLKHGDDYTGYVVWFDKDTYLPSQDSNLKNSLESKDNLEIYISNPCIENWLLAHFQYKLAKTNNCNTCKKKLQKYIPDYCKNDCLLLNEYITKKNIKSAIQNYPDIGKLASTYFNANNIK